MARTPEETRELQRDVAGAMNYVLDRLPPGTGVALVVIAQDPDGFLAATEGFDFETAIREMQRTRDGFAESVSPTSLTADTIADEQIRELQGGAPSLVLMRICAEALAAERPGCTRRYHARAYLAALINDAKGAT